MKILYLDINIQYHNPTRNNIVLLLKNISDLYIYGLGYQSESVLNQGVEEFYKDNAPFDFIITNEHIIFGTQNISSNLATTVDAYRRNYYLQFDLSHIRDNLNDMYDFFQKKEIINRAIFLLESDYYNFQQQKIDRLKSLNAYIIGWGDSFLAPVEKLEDLKRESFGAKANNNWYNFVLKNPQIIQFPHFVNSSEYYFENLDNRKNTIQVAGTNYYHRKKVLEVISNTKYKSKPKIYPKIYSIMRKLKIKPDTHPILMRLYNTLFRNEIEQTKYIFTCGSGLEWAIRKFFEIPALGSLLLAKPFYNAENLGFIDGKNYIKTDYRDIIDKIEWLQKNPQEAQEIAKSGQDMIWKKHSLDARSKQLKKSFEKIIENRFNGTYWKYGEFYVK